MSGLRRYSLRWGLRVAAVIAIAVALYFVLDTDWPNLYSPPTGGEEFSPTGKYFAQHSKSSSVADLKFIRDLTELETAAFRFFIEEADYDELTAYKDQVDMRVVQIDGVNWCVYRDGLFRVESGDSEHRLVIDGVKLTKQGERHEVDFDALIEWYGSQE